MDLRTCQEHPATKTGIREAPQPEKVDTTTTTANYTARESSPSTATTAPILQLQSFSSTGRRENWTYTRRRQIPEAELKSTG